MQAYFLSATRLNMSGASRSIAESHNPPELGTGIIEMVNLGQSALTGTELALCVQYPANQKAAELRLAYALRPEGYTSVQNRDFAYTPKLVPNQII